MARRAPAGREMAGGVTARQDWPNGIGWPGEGHTGLAGREKAGRDWPAGRRSDEHWPAGRRRDGSAPFGPDWPAIPRFLMVFRTVMCIDSFAPVGRRRANNITPLVSSVGRVEIQE